ncbi:hypothetical protein [Streptomyces rugosispiralis]|uniref:UL36 very large tegument protein n=1 Tax=Streptomyces rugosispiralis TaxID=2967341 RepID=A0ABT1V596_9ACTN|nr:hypothetical protein [Streptomyces rugosispiralis]MCQ8192567.1 hypothetical protein [Streptomyces rugosispiralis]
MASGQLPAEVEEFATYLRVLTRRLDAGAGWYGVFALRDPDGLRACLDGLEVPPWDLVQSLLQDLSAQHGPGAAQEAASRAATLYRASVAAHDAGPGRREALQDRLNGMLRQRRNAARRAADLRSALSTAEDPAARNSLAAELAWAHDDHQRATARTEELQARLAALPGVSRLAQVAEAGAASTPDTLTSAAAPAWGVAGGAGHPRGARFAGVGEAGAVPRPRGARFAGAGDGDDGAAGVPTPDSPTPSPAESGAGGRATPRGARFAGAYDDEDGGKRRKRDRAADDGRRLARAAAERTAARRAAQEAVARLGRLRAEGRSGEAHVVLYEAAVWPAARLPVLAEELERAGFGADVSTLLWEAACLPPAQLAAAAEALCAADREADGEGLLRQSVSRPVPEVAHTAKALLAAGAPSRAAFLLEALVRARTPEDAARAAAEDPATLVPLLLAAAAGVSSSTQHDLAHALRTARLPGVPGLA